ncbi:MAG: DUF2235 domain-containing protein [Rhodovulum sp.]|jgi:uncharacterized protein (DUF2235 family)|nr:hypothetical protein [Rhodovulum sp.]MCI5087121.1 DUF2235 domain-containing protein [Rhodovulum sp.]
MGIARRTWDWLRGLRQTEAHQPSFARVPLTHVIILDGTNSSLDAGHETHAGLTYKMLSRLPASAHLSLYYEAGVQWTTWRNTHHVAFGRGINSQIKRAYGYLASRYHPGDRIIFLGYSRGAFAVRSLAGVIDRVGLLQGRYATERNVEQAYRLYRKGARTGAAAVFNDAYCHPTVDIQMVGVWDTVKALGVRLPVLWKLTEEQHAFHDHSLSDNVRHGYHALALDETREAFEPVLWQSRADWHGRLEQVWFPGTHGDVGGHIDGDEDARPLANLSLVWMLARVEKNGVPLPDGWRAHFPCDPMAPSVGLNRGWGRLFLLRHTRVVGADPSETLHPSVYHRRVTAGIEVPDIPMPPLQNIQHMSTGLLRPVQDHAGR